MEYIKMNPSVSESYLYGGSSYIYENKDLKGPKILLNQGWAKVSEFVSILKNTKPLKPLTFNSKLCLDVPNSKSDWTSKEIFMKLISNKKKELKINKISFHYDIGYKHAATSAFLQLVDDNIGFNGNRRNNILNPEVTQVGISNITIGIKTCTYVLFKKNEGSNFNSGTKPEDSTNLTNM